MYATVNMSRVLLLLLVVSVHGMLSDPPEEEWESVLWDPTGVGGMVWEDQPLPAVQNVSVATNTTPTVNTTVRELTDDSVHGEIDFSDDLVWRPMGNVSLNFTHTENIISSESSGNALIDLVFDRQELDLYHKLNTLLDGLLGFAENTTVTDGSWSFVTFITLMPLRCSEVQKVVALFDEAMRQSNPGSDVTSTAQRLGAATCGADGVCPCKESRRYSQRVMELRSTSKQRSLQPPARFPYPVQIEKS